MRNNIAYLLNVSGENSSIRLPLGIFLCLFLWFSGGYTAGFSADRSVALPSQVFSFLKKQRLPVGSLSVYVQALHHDQSLVSYHADQKRSPASVIKLFTTVAALDILGPSYQWETAFYTSGRIKNHKLSGDLILRGGGDPYFLLEDLWLMLYEMRQRGLQEFDRLIVDDSLFAEETKRQEVFDNNHYRVYNGSPNAALINFWASRLTVYQENNRIHAINMPPLSNVEIINKLRPVSGRCGGRLAKIQLDFQPADAGAAVTFSGKFPVTCGEYALNRSVLAGADYVYGIVSQLWQDMGGKIVNGYAVQALPSQARRFLTRRSAPLSQVVRAINKYSNNIMADNLFLTLGLAEEGKPATWQKSRRAVTEWLDGVSISAPELIMENGSGLSRTTRVSARSVAKVLRYAHSSPYSPEFLSSLPLNGIDGTMRKRLTEKPYRGKFRLKTGSLNDVRSIAGYVTTQRGEQYVVVIMQNAPGVDGWIGIKVQDIILRWLHDTY